MTNAHARRRFRRVLTGSALAAVLAAGAPFLAGTAAAAAPAAPEPPAAAAVEPPGPPGDLTLAPRNGSGARGVAFTASWQQPDLHGGTSPRYVVTLADDIGGVREQTTTATSEPQFGDRCLAPYTVTVRTQTTDPATGGTLTGPPASGTFGKRDLCEIRMSLTAAPGPAPGTAAVSLHREPPVDPYVGGPCVLVVDGVERWNGVCGGTQPERTVTVDGLAPGPHDAVLRTTTPRHVVLDSNHVTVVTS